MSDNINLKALWQQPNPTPPNAQVVIQKAQSYQRRQKMQLWVTTISLVVTCIAIAGIWWYYQPDYWTTKLGIVLAIVAMLLVIIIQNKQLPLLAKAEQPLSNKQYLHLLQAIAQEKAQLQTHVLTWYFILLSTGLALYFYEYTLKMSPLWAGLCYGLTALWIAFNWWYIRPRSIQKQQQELQDLQGQLQALEGQLEEEGL